MSSNIETGWVDDAGLGLMFNFENTYSIDWSKRDGDNGIYLSLNLLNFWKMATSSGSATYLTCVKNEAAHLH